MRTVQEALRVAGDIGARGIDTGPGSMDPTGPWNPHPENWSQRSRDQLIKSLRECVKAAADNQVYLSLEGHQLVVLEDEQVTKEILGCGRIRRGLDPIWIRRTGLR